MLTSEPGNTCERRVSCRVLDVAVAEVSLQRGASAIHHHCGEPPHQR